MLEIEAAGLTDVGRVRAANEDAYLIDDSRRVYVVADGMGGHLAGEVASGLVVETITACLADAGRCLPEPGDESLSTEANRVLAWIRSANQAVFQKSRQDSSCRGMGSTIAVVHCTASTLIAANVGDSPIYLLRGDTIELISVAHTVAAEQAANGTERGRLLAENFKHMLSRAIGVGERVVPDVCEIQLFPGDRIILCSDGLSNAVSPQELLAITGRYAPATACQALVDLANERGGRDNITAIVIDVRAARSQGRRIVDRLLKRQ